MTAAWLMGYTDGKMNFPRDGDEKRRNAAIAVVRDQLERAPEALRVLSKSYWEDGFQRIQKSNE